MNGIKYTYQLRIHDNIYHHWNGPFEDMIWSGSDVEDAAPENPFALGNFAAERVSKLVDPFSSHCLAKGL